MRSFANRQVKQSHVSRRQQQKKFLTLLPWAVGNNHSVISQCLNYINVKSSYLFADVLLHFFLFSKVLSPGFVRAMCPGHCGLFGGVHLQSELHQESVPYCQIGGGAVCHQPSRTASYSAILWNDGESPIVHQTPGPCSHEVLHWWVLSTVSFYNVRQSSCNYWCWNRK